MLLQSAAAASAPAAVSIKRKKKKENLESIKSTVPKETKSGWRRNETVACYNLASEWPSICEWHSLQFKFCGHFRSAAPWASLVERDTKAAHKTTAHCHSITSRGKTVQQPVCDENPSSAGSVTTHLFNQDSLASVSDCSINSSQRLCSSSTDAQLPHSFTTPQKAEGDYFINKTLTYSHIL